MTIFLGCGFAAKYREGGGNFSVPLQWMLGLRRLKLDAIWLELLPATDDPEADQARIDNFQTGIAGAWIAGRYCLLYQKPAANTHDLDAMRCIGMSKRKLLDRLAGPNILLNLRYSIHPPLLLKFERRILCDLDPSEIFYWMTKMEMGSRLIDEFWTVGLNVHGGLSAAETCGGSRAGCAAIRLPLQLENILPAGGHEILPAKTAAAAAAKFTTVGQWYWGGAVEVAGEFPDLSKRFAFGPYLDLPARVPEARFELAMNIAADDPERATTARLGWKIVDPHRVARTPRLPPVPSRLACGIHRNQGRRCSVAHRLDQ